MRVTVRGYAGAGRKRELELIFRENTELEPGSNGIELLAERHASFMKEHKRWMIELEFLDIPEAEGRYFRFGSTKAGMVLPVAISVD
jgi:hypothetical protein